MFNKDESADSSQNTSSQSKLSKIRTSFSPFEKKTSVARRTSIATNPNVMWKLKPKDVSEL